MTRPWAVELYRTPRRTFWTRWGARRWADQFRGCGCVRIVHT